MGAAREQFRRDKQAIAREVETQGMEDIPHGADMRPANEVIARVRENWPPADVVEVAFDLALRNVWQEDNLAQKNQEVTQLREALKEREGAENHSADREEQEI
jgi:hypothetical protein